MNNLKTRRFVRNLVLGFLFVFTHKTISWSLLQDKNQQTNLILENNGQSYLDDITTPTSTPLPFILTVMITYIPIELKKEIKKFDLIYNYCKRLLIN